MFRSELLERLSHVHPGVPHLLYVPLILVMLWLGARSGRGAIDLALLVVVGALLWSLTEYVIHRFVFHPPQWIEDDTRRIVGGLDRGEAVMPALPTWRHKFYFLVHGVHHDYPNDSSRLVMPPSVSIPLAVLFYLLFRFTAGPDVAPLLFAGFVSGYLFYDTTHYFTHHGSGRTGLGRAQKRRHFRHHYFDSTRDYGVSSALWDAVMGTLGRRRAGR